jgi:NitT/TauT family transport system ATP-binding protein
MALEKELEQTFAQIHLDGFTATSEEALANNLYPSPSLVDHMDDQQTTTASDLGPAQPPSRPRERRFQPLMHTNLTLVEGLVSRLSTEMESTDLYDLCEDMGQSVDQGLPAIVAAEALGFITTPGVKVILTEFGRAFAKESDAEKRLEMMRSAVLKLPVISKIYDMVLEGGSEGLDDQDALEQIITLLPFEDHDAQFQTLIKWCRYVNLITYDADEKRLFVSQD